MLLEPDATAVVAVVAVGVALLALLLVAVLLLRMGQLNRILASLATDDQRESFQAVMARQRAGAESLHEAVQVLHTDLAMMRAELSGAVRHVAVVRYDAFGDMGGRLSFSAALLDDTGDGMVLTSINARSETRSYAKGVKGGGSDHDLSPEEQEAITYAMNPPAVEPTPGGAPDRRGRRRLTRT